MFNVTGKNFISYAVLPGFKPRVKALFASGFRYVAYYMAIVFSIVRLLPAQHPYLNPANIGRFGIVHVIAEAANNIIVSRKNIDQIIVFFCILLGMVLLLLQLGILAFTVFIQPVSAQIILPASGFFTTTAAQQQTDLAGIMLDMVFGIAGIFNSCVSTNVTCLNSEGAAINSGIAGAVWTYQPRGTFPMPIHQGMHQVFQLYSLGLLVVAAMIALYFIAAIVLETAESGTPFGKRFNRVWAPIRLVVAFGLLIPVGSGLNSSQYIVLYAAKFGSGFASNAWFSFNDALANANGGSISNLLSDRTGDATRLIAQPSPPEIGALLQFVFVAKTCAEMENALLGITDPTNQNQRQHAVLPYLVREQTSANPAYMIERNTPYDDLIAFAGGNSTITIRFGRRNTVEYNTMLGNVSPVCGDLTFPLADPRASGTAEAGVEAMQRYYWFVLKELWYDVLPSGNIPVASTSGNYNVNYAANYPLGFFQKFYAGQNSASAQIPDDSVKQTLQNFYSGDLRNALNDPNASGLTGILNVTGNNGAIAEMALSGRWTMNNTVRDKGWAGAAIWFNRIAEMNGAMTTAVLNIPMPARYPAVMEHVYREKRKYDENMTFLDRFNPVKGDNKPVQNLTTDLREKATVLWESFNYWQKGGLTTTNRNKPTGNAVKDILNALLGTSGLFSMRANADIHPIAQLAGLGRAMVEGAIRNLTYAAIGGLGGAGLAAISENFMGATASAVSSLLITFAMIALTAGFIMFYVVPLLPFVYFFFGLSSWVKAIFEAMVGAPLWALAHIRIDGNGLSGQAALSGYFLVFEIFLRPILMIFGLLASISIFSALVSVLNQVFDIVVHNLGGFDLHEEFTNASGTNERWISSMRGAVDEFFYTIVYAIVVYMIGMSCFKLIDLIPNNILRWIGQSISTFGDQREDMGQQLVGSATTGTQQALGAIGGGLQNVAKLGSG